MRSGQAKLIKQLVHERQAEVDLRDKDGWTPLLYAALTYERADSGAATGHRIEFVQREDECCDGARR